jgi:hypothetical protein
VSGIREESGTCAERVEPCPLLGVAVVPVWPNAVEVHFPPACPERAPLVRIDVDNGAHHITAVLGVPSAVAEVRDAGRARVAPARVEEDGDWVDVRVVEEEASRFGVGEERRRCVHASYLPAGNNCRRMEGRAVVSVRDDSKRAGWGVRAMYRA